MGANSTASELARHTLCLVCYISGPGCPWLAPKWWKKGPMLPRPGQPVFGLVHRYQNVPRCPGLVQKGSGLHAPISYSLRPPRPSNCRGEGPGEHLPPRKGDRGCWTLVPEEIVWTRGLIGCDAAPYRAPRQEVVHPSPIPSFRRPGGTLAERRRPKLSPSGVMNNNNTRLNERDVEGGQGSKRMF